MYSRRNCLVLQPGERWQATACWNSADGAEAAQGLPLHEVELAVDTEDMLLVVDVGLSRVHRSRYWCYRHDAQKVRVPEKSCITLHIASHVQINDSPVQNDVNTK